jgi:cytochrome c peroxidase
MKRNIILSIAVAIIALACFSFKDNSDPAKYVAGYRAELSALADGQRLLLDHIAKTNLSDSNDLAALRAAIHTARLNLKGIDFWLRYLSPNDYRRMNGPLPVEWETEVFEKFEKPYRREGAGLILAELYLDEETPVKDTLSKLISASLAVVQNYAADTITRELASYHHFFLCNRLYLLNLAAVYTTGFECPDTSRVIPELRAMLHSTRKIYELYNESFPAHPVSQAYRSLYDSAIRFTDTQPAAYSAFDHFGFIKDYVNPLFALNAGMMQEYGVVSHSLVDYTLNKSATSIFSKALYRGQNAKGLYTRIRDPALLADIDRVGKLLFYDPILSGNNKRSCASCHKPSQCFTDTLGSTAFAFNHKDFLSRNTPSLVNADFNHLAMLDGAHISLQHQAKGVMTNAREMGGREAEIVKKVMSCEEYANCFKKLLAYTPQEPQVSLEHIASALTMFYARFSASESPFDAAIQSAKPLDANAHHGFNLFMSRAQCATCHFVPQFNGVKPPYVGSEFEVLGVPRDTAFRMISPDSGRYLVNPASQTMHAFRTGTVRNAARTAPYMHNGVFRSLHEVIDFYDRGGGAGRGLAVENQTLSADSLHLTMADKRALIAFVESLNETFSIDIPPVRLPRSKITALNSRKPGGVY